MNLFVVVLVLCVFSSPFGKDMVEREEVKGKIYENIKYLKEAKDELQQENDT